VQRADVVEDVGVVEGHDEEDYQEIEAPHHLEEADYTKILLKVRGVVVVVVREGRKRKRGKGKSEAISAKNV